MKTIEERAKAYSLKDFDGYYTGREEAVEEGYIAGAKEQKAKDDAELLKIKSSWEKQAQITHDDKANYQQGYHDAIENTCKWLKENARDYACATVRCPYGEEEEIICDVHLEIVEDFRKAMEE